MKTIKTVLTAALVMAIMGAIPALAVQKAHKGVKAQKGGDEYTYVSVIDQYDYVLVPVAPAACLRAERAYPEFTGMPVEAKGSAASVAELKKWLVWRGLMQAAPEERSSSYNITQQFSKTMDGVLGIKFGADLGTVPGFDVNHSKGAAGRTGGGCPGGNERYAFAKDGDFSPSIRTSTKPTQTGYGKLVSITAPQAPKAEEAPAPEESGFFGKIGQALHKTQPAESGTYQIKMMESKVSEVFGIKVRDISYMTDQNYKFVGFVAHLNTRPSFDATPTLQQSADVFDGAISALGPPAVIFKKNDNGRLDRVGIWLSENGVRIDVMCRGYQNDSGKCLKGLVQVRQLPAAINTGTSEGASKFFE